MYLLNLVLLVVIMVLLGVLNSKDKEIEILHSLSTEDPLTGLLNRLGYDQAMVSLKGMLPSLGQAYKERRSQLHSLVLIMFDLDRFKEVNDTLGHPAGDKLLSEVAKIIKNNSRSTDYVCRWGGDEFALLMPDADLNVATLVATRIRKCVEQIELQRGIVPSVSAGIYLATNQAEAEEIAYYADKNLCAVKGRGKNEVAFSTVKEKVQFV